MSTDTVSPLRQRMIEDMNARKLCAGTQRGHIHSCKRFAAFLKRSPATATAEDIRQFQLHLSETGASICNRNRIMTGLRFLFRVTLRRLDLAAEIYHIREPQKIPLVMSADETKRLLAVASSLKARILLSLSYGCGLRAGEVVRLKVKHIDKAQNIIRIEQSKGRKDRNVMLSPETLGLLRQWWKVRRGFDATTPLQERWLFPGRKFGTPMTPRQRATSWCCRVIQPSCPTNAGPHCRFSSRGSRRSRSGEARRRRDGCGGDGRESANRGDFCRASGTHRQN